MTRWTTIDTVLCAVALGLTVLTLVVLRFWGER
jgi:hypothetical protein